MMEEEYIVVHVPEGVLASVRLSRTRPLPRTSASPSGLGGNRQTQALQ